MGVLERIRINLNQELRTINKFSDSTDQEIKEAIDKLLNKAFDGWRNAPDVFIDRIDFLLNSHRKFKVPTKELPSEEPILRDPITFVNDQIPKDVDERTKEILEGMSKSERRFWKERFKIYNDEFNFNLSSDQTLIYQLLTEELIQHRLMVKKITDPEADTDQEMTNSMKRLKDCMEALGITRKQRQAAKSDDEDGSLSQIVAMVDKKARTVQLIEKRDIEEERMYAEIKASRGVTNNIPGIEDIKKIEKEFGLKDVK